MRRQNARPDVRRARMSSSLHMVVDAFVFSVGRSVATVTGLRKTPKEASQAAVGRQRDFVIFVLSSFNRKPKWKKSERKRKRRDVRLKRTNLRVKGLSLNRSQKRTALLSTTPRLRPRSSTNDLAPLHRTWLLSHSAHGRVASASASSRCAVALPPRVPRSVDPRLLSPADVEALTVSSRFSGRDSGLEAFSHNPSDGSFAPLAYQPST